MCRTPRSPPPPRTLLPLLMLLPLLAPGCDERGPSHEGPDVAAYLMPPGKSRADLRMQRRVSGPGRDPLVQPRLLVAERSPDGVVYTIREQVDRASWRTAAKLFFTVTAKGAYLTRQEDLTGQPVGVRERRLVLPWPLRAGHRRSLDYRLLGSHEDGGRRTRATVTVTRSDFSERIAGKRVGPCVEVREVLLPDVGGSVDIRSVFCRGIGRVHVEQRSESLSRGETLVSDRVLGLGAEGS